MTLTRRQQEVHSLLTQGKSNKQIGRELGISPDTAKDHCRRIYEALGVRNRWDLVRPPPAPVRHLPGTIAEQASSLVGPVLATCIRERTRLGIAKYGQTLDDNDQPQRARAVHFVQEMLDGTQYALWLGDPSLAARCAIEAELVTRRYGLIAEEIMQGGKQ